jgi:glycosyltransferase involved in cell wall biosynthesis
LPYHVVYGPGWSEAWRLLRWADVVQFSHFDYRWWLLTKLLGKRTIFIYHAHSRICPKGVAWNGREACSFATHWRQCPSCLHRDRSWLLTWAKWLSLPVKRRLVDGADVVVNTSRYAERTFGVKGGRTIPMGIDQRRFQPAENPRRDCLLFIGRLIEEKGCQILLESFAQCLARGRTMRLVIVGDGPYRGELEALAARLGITHAVIFRGEMTGAALVEQMQHATAVIVPSIGPEGWGRVPIEALSCGTPVIVAASGGLQDVGEAALMYPPLDRAALAEHLIRISEEASLRERLVAAGRSLLRQHDIERMAAQYLALYRELTDER